MIRTEAELVAALETIRAELLAGQYALRDDAGFTVGVYGRAVKRVRPMQGEGGWLIGEGEGPGAFTLVHVGPGFDAREAARDLLDRAHKHYGE